MKNLFKSSFRRFFKSKLGLILTTVIVFLTAAAFTMMHSTAATFNASYKKVLDEGNVHDFTLSELYSSSGDFELDTTDTHTVSTEIEDYKGSFKTRNIQDEYIYFTSKDISSSITYNFQGTEIPSNTFGMFRVKRSDLELIFDLSDAQHIKIKDDAKLPFSILYAYDKSNGNHFRAFGKSSEESMITDIDKLKDSASRNDFILIKPSNIFTQGSFANWDNRYLDKTRQSNLADRSQWPYLVLDLTKSADSSQVFTTEASTNDEAGTHPESSVSFKDVAAFKSQLLALIQQNAVLKEREVYKVNKIVVDKQVTDGVETPVGKYAQLDGRTSIPALFDGKVKDNALPFPEILIDKGSNIDIKNTTEYGQVKAKIKSYIDDVVTFYQRQSLVASVENGFPKYKDHLFHEKYVQSLSIDDKSNRFKVVDSLDNDDVDSIVLFHGSKPSNNIPAQERMRSLFTKIISEIRGGYVYLENIDYKTEGVPQFTASSGYTGKITVSYQGNSPSNYIPSGIWSIHFEIPLKTLLDLAQQTPGLQNQKVEIHSEKLYKITASWDQEVNKQQVVPHSIQSIDPASSQVIVSPSYADKHDIKVMSTDKALNDASSDVFINDQKAYHNQNPNSTIVVGTNVYQVVGIGTTPDYMFPIIDEKSPIPNANNQAVLFVNSYGFSSFLDAYRGNNQENYVAFKFYDDVPDDVRKSVLESMEAHADEIMTLSGFKAVRAREETKNALNLSSQRILPIKTIKDTINAVSWVIPIILIIVVAFIVMVIIKTQVSGMKKQFGILIANGYSKMQVAFSMTTIALLVGLAAGILGYIAGHFLEYAFTGAFDSYWTLPIVNQAFSWVSLLIVTAWPVVGIGIFAFFVTMWEMRGPLVALLNGNESKFTQKVAATITSPFRYFGIKTKASLSILGTNLFKMILTSVALGLSIITLAVAFTTMGKFGLAKNKSLEDNHYNFKVNLLSPTTSGGALSAITLDELYKGEDSLRTSPDGDKAYIYIPNAHDDKGKYALDFLKNKIQLKALLNVDVGGAGISTNPWTIASSLMPSNQKHDADARNLNFMRYILKVNYDKRNDQKIHPLLKSIADQLVVDWDQYDKNNVVDSSSSFNKAQFFNVGLSAANGKTATEILNPEYVHLVISSLRKLIKEIIDNPSSELKDTLPALISYGHPIIEHNDEKYTYISTYSEFKQGSKITHEKFDIVGVQKDSTKYTKNDVVLKIEEYQKNNPNSNEVPVVINSYLAYKYKIGEGDTFDGVINNRLDRYKVLFDNPNPPVVHRKFIIVGVDETYNGVKVITSQKVANDVLGYKNNDFNGIFTSEKSPLVLQTINLYSKSGIYPGSDRISSSHGVQTNLLQALKTGGKYPWSGKSQVQNISQFTGIFSDTPLNIAYSSVDWNKVSVVTFKNISDLSEIVIWVIMSIIILISVLFVAMISSIITNQSKKFLATMKVMGYKTSEIRKMFLGAFVLPLFISLAIAIPGTIFALGAIESLIMNFGDIVIPLTMTWWEIPIAILTVIILFIGVFLSSEHAIKDTSLTQAFT